MFRILPILILAAAPLQAQGSLADFVPPSTPVIVEFDDLGGAEFWKENLAIGRICAEPEVQRFLAGLRESIAKGVRGQRSVGPDFFTMVGLEPSDFLAVKIRRGGVALVGLDPERRGYPDVVAMLELRAGEKEAEKILRQFRAALSMFAGASWSSEKEGGVTLWSVAMGDVEMAHAIAGKHVFFTTGLSRLKQTLALRTGAGMPRLAGEKTYHATRAKMGAGRAAVFAYANARGLFRAIRPMLRDRDREQAEAMMAATGLDAVESIAFADIPAGPNFRTEICVMVEERRGFLGLYPSAPTAHPFAGKAPRNPLLYGAERFDASAFLEKAIAWAGSLEPEIEGEYRALLERYNRVLGIDVEKELVGSLGDEWAFYLGDTPGGALVPDMVVLVSLKDRAKFEKSMRALVERYPDVLEMHGETRGARIRHRKTSFLERDIHLLEITEHDGDPVPVVPCWTVADDHAAFALYPHALKHLLTNRPSFDGNRAFAAALKHVPEGAVSHTYFDLPRVVGYLYNTAVPVLQGLQGAIDRELAPYGASVNLHDLPRAEAITKHLSPCVSYTRVEKNALRFGYVSPCGHWLVTGTGAAAGLAVALVAQGEAMAMDRTEAEKARMRAEITALRNRLRAERARWAKRLAELEAKVEELARILEEDG